MAPQPICEAYVVIVIFGQPWSITRKAVGTEMAHHSNSPMLSVDRDMFTSKSPRADFVLILLPFPSVYNTGDQTPPRGTKTLKFQSTRQLHGLRTPGHAKLSGKEQRPCQPSLGLSELSQM